MGPRFFVWRKIAGLTLCLIEADIKQMACKYANNIWVIYNADSITPESGLPAYTLFGHALLTALVPYIYTRCRSYALSHGWPDAPNSDSRRKFWKLLNKCESTHSLLSMLNFIMFLSNGQYVSAYRCSSSVGLIWSQRCRTLADRILSLRLMPTRQLSTRAVSYEFMNRQMVWHAFTVRCFSFIAAI